MDPSTLRTLLARLEAGDASVEDVVDELKTLPFSDLGFAKIDHHRQLRQGFPEGVLGSNKSAEELVGIFREIDGRGQNALATRVDKDKGHVLLGEVPGVVYSATARVATLSNHPRPNINAAPVCIVSAGTSDAPVAEEAALTAEFLGNEIQHINDVGVAGLHRLLPLVSEINRASVVIVVAGMEGALPSVIGGLVSPPVIAVPTSIGYGASFGGVAALLGMLNSCAAGVTVVNIDNGYGAAVAASRINGHQ